MARTARKRSFRKRALAELRWWSGWALRKTMWFAILAALLFILWQRDVLRVPIAAIIPSSNIAFDQWLSEDAAREEEFAQFKAYLAEQGVADVVPAWQLARIDAAYAKACNLPIFRLPPRELWPNVVPALKLVREHVVPTVGAVEVASSYRTPALNACARGAGRSRHLGFEALDLLPKDRPDDLALHYGSLCAMQARAGAGSAMGLGAYYDPTDPSYNPAGKFHIDAAGFRSWGRTYRAASSPCPQ